MEAQIAGKFKIQVRYSFLVYNYTIAAYFLNKKRDYLAHAGNSNLMGCKMTLKAPLQTMFYGEICTVSQT